MTEQNWREWTERLPAVRLATCRRLLGRWDVLHAEHGPYWMEFNVSGPGAFSYVRLTERSVQCSCGQCTMEEPCNHAVAVVLDGLRTGAIAGFLRGAREQRAAELLRAVEEQETRLSAVRLEVSLALPAQPDGCVWASLRIGDERLYVVRSIPELLGLIRERGVKAYGSQFTFNGEWMHFDEADSRVLAVFAAYFDALSSGGHPLSSASAIPCEGQIGEDLLDALEGLSFRITSGKSHRTAHGVLRGAPQIGFRIGGGLHGLHIQAEMGSMPLPLTSSYSHVFTDGQVRRVPPEQRALLRAVCGQLAADPEAEFAFTAAQTERILSEVLPELKRFGTVTLAPELQDRLVDEPLHVTVWLDRERNTILAETRFRYGTLEINPFSAAGSGTVNLPDGRILTRRREAEQQVLDLLGANGFRMGQGRIYLRDDDAIFHFMTGGLQELQKVSEVYCSNEFRRFEPRPARLQVALALRAGRLELTVEGDEVPSAEALGIMQALARRHSYFRLKDGAYLDLNGLEGWERVADMIDTALRDGAATEKGGHVELLPCRTLELADLLEERGLAWRQDLSVADMRARLSHLATPDVRLPDGLALRGYQQRGYAWLHTLDQLHMGGVLADDMGLGKTVQVIALLRQLQAPGAVSLVVAPTSLTYNWLSELQRFAPELSATVLSGTAQQREQVIAHVRGARDVDVLITSYPLIRRDIDLIAELPFRTVILDEAQQIKNAGSVGASAVKRLQAESRFALTGTPMENHVGELWSIYDFVLPGFLGSWPRFLRDYQEEGGPERLRAKIRPFLMRRLKKDVLTELPDKIETVMTAHMTPEQEKVYHASALRLRRHVDDIIGQKGFQRSRIEVLAAITELRQICCHPGLLLQDYLGSSGKMELLMDVLPGAVAAGRRVLLFSQFTSMLKLLEKQLSSLRLKCLYLDGDTPAANRLQLCERFNAGDGDVFLISLKAGGTGLNLIGADMVIHYDPWWNPAAEDQATDRAHRIGQTHKVEVLRLVTGDSIEEKVVELGLKKRELFDRLITPGEESIAAMSESDLRGLFS